MAVPGWAAEPVVPMSLCSGLTRRLFQRALAQGPVRWNVLKGML